METWHDVTLKIAIALLGGKKVKILIVLCIGEDYSAMVILD